MNTKAPLPAGTTLGKSYEYGLDINIAAALAETALWQSVRRISGFQPSPTPATTDSQTYDDLGSPNNDVTGWSMNLAFNVQVNRSVTSGLYLPEVEKMLAATGAGSVGELAVIEARWYHKPATGKPNPTDAGRGFFTVGYTRQNTGAEGANEVLAVTLTGKGEYTKIANPWLGWGDTEPEE